MGKEWRRRFDRRGDRSLDRKAAYPGRRARDRDATIFQRRNLWPLLHRAIDLEDRRRSDRVRALGPVGARRAAFGGPDGHHVPVERSEEHTSELQSLMRLSYAVFFLA